MQYSMAVVLLKSPLLKHVPRFRCTNISSGSTSKVPVSVIQLSEHPTHMICGSGLPRLGMKSAASGSTEYCFKTAAAGFGKPIFATQKKKPILREERLMATVSIFNSHFPGFFPDGNGFTYVAHCWG